MAERSEIPTRIYDLSAIDQAVLTPVVRRAFNDATISVSEWKYSRVYSAGDVGAVLSGVFRFSGSARAEDHSVDWSLILKVVGTTDTSDNPSEPRYWKREVQAYQSGKLGNLAGNIAAPRFFGTIEFSEKVVGLWLEDLVDEVGPDWPLKRYGSVARHLGEFNGTYLVKQELPSWPWLSRDWVRGIVRGEGPKFAQLSQSLGQSSTQRWFIGDDAIGILRLWEERRLFLDALDGLPKTLLHRDAHRNNLFTSRTEDGSDLTVIVDWAFTGIGAVGEEISYLIQGSLCFSQVDIAEVHEFDKIVFGSYLEGLAEVGWRGDPDLVRLGYTAASALVYGLGYGLFQLNENLFPWYERAFGRPIDEIMDLFARQNHFLLALVDEAKTLLSFMPEVGPG